MRFLVTATPKFDVPSELLPSLLDAEPEWRERYRDRLDAYAWFPGGGGFGIADVDSEETLSAMVSEHPFSWCSDTQLRPIVDADVAVGQARAALERMTARA